MWLAVKRAVSWAEACDVANINAPAIIRIDAKIFFILLIMWFLTREIPRLHSSINMGTLSRVISRDFEWFSVSEFLVYYQVHDYKKAIFE